MVRPTCQSHKDLIVWQKSLELATIDRVMPDVDEIGRMLTGVIAGLQRRLDESADREILAKR